jgi:hypothetical protein
MICFGHAFIWRQALSTLLMDATTIVFFNCMQIVVVHDGYFV